MTHDFKFGYAYMLLGKYVIYPYAMNCDNRMGIPQFHYIGENGKDNVDYCEMFTRCPEFDLNISTQTTQIPSAADTSQNVEYDL